MRTIKKYPRTKHIQGSKLQNGDEDLSQVAFDSIDTKNLIVEEKVDGANAGISFTEDCKLLLQSRGHYLRGGPREKHWDMFKSWASYHENELLNVLEDRYIMYGEWCLAKHTVFYDLLPHYFLEFDIYDTKNDVFLSTKKRRQMLEKTSIKSVFVLHEGDITFENLKKLIRPSYFKSGIWTHNLSIAASDSNVDSDVAVNQTDKSNDMEGLYLKIENDDIVLERLKFVRNTFMNSIADSETHWLDRPIIKNRLAPGVKIF